MYLNTLEGLNIDVGVFLLIEDLQHELKYGRHAAGQLLAHLHHKHNLSIKIPSQRPSFNSIKRYYNTVFLTTIPGPALFEDRIRS